jgi:hypothetical protein
MKENLRQAAASQERGHSPVVLSQRAENGWGKRCREV